MKQSLVDDQMIDPSSPTYLFQNRAINVIGDYLKDNPQLNIIEMLDKNKNTILHQLAYENNLDILKLYIKHANAFLREKIKHQRRVHGDKIYTRDQKQQITKWINMQNDEGFTAFLYAAYNGHLEVMKYLADQLNANVTLCTKTNLNALHLAAQNNKVLTFLFVDDKIQLDEVDKGKSTPLHWASYMNSEQVVAYILTKPLRTMNRKDAQGQTPLMLAVFYGNTRVVRRLLLKGANRYLRNNQGKSALDIAKENQYRTITRMLDQDFNCLDFIKFYCNVKIQYKPKTRKYTIPIFFLLSFITVVTIFNVLIKFNAFEGSGCAVYAEGGIFLFALVFYLSLLGSPKKYEPEDSKNFMDQRKIKKVCFECHIIKPTRGYHCDICGVCIPQYDHHCTWINNCVGKRNIGRFIFFLIFLILSLGLVGLVSFLSFICFFTGKYDQFHEWFEFRQDFTLDSRQVQLAKWCAICMTGLNFIASVFIFPVVMLFIVQIKNLLKNKTTYQTIRGPQEETSPNKQKLRKHKHNLSLGNCKVMCSDTHQSFLSSTTHSNEELLSSSKFPSEKQEST